MLSFYSIAQTGNIQGHVKFNDNEIAIGTYVLLKGETLKKGTATGVNGEFGFKVIPYGRYVVEIHSLNAKVKTIDVVLNSKNKVLDIILERAEHQELEEVTVKNKSTKRKIEEKGFAVNVIETKEVAFQSIQVNELLDRSVGVRIRQSGGLGSRANYMLNGMSGNSVRIFIDGVPIRNFGPSFSLNSIPPSIIKRIEVYKGVVPAHLSDDAMGGAINIVLNTSTTNNLTVSTSAGSFGTYRADATGAYRDEKSGFTVKGSAFFNYSDNSYKVWGDQVTAQTSIYEPVFYLKAKRFHDRYRSQGGKAEIGYTNVSWADKLLVGALLSHMDKQVQTAATMEIVYGNRHYNQNTNMFSVDYAKSNIFEGFDASTFISHSKLTRKVIDTIATQYSWLGHPKYDRDGNVVTWTSGAEAGRPTLQEDIDQTVNMRTNLTYRINEQNKIQLNHLLNTFKRDTDDPMLPQVQNNLREKRSYTKNIISLSVDNVSFNERLRTSGFLKSYHMDRVSEIRTLSENSSNAVYYLNKTPIKSNDLGYGGAISYDISEKLTIFGSAEKAIRYPEPNEVFGNNALNVNASLTLKPEKSNNYNLGISLSDIDFKNHSFGISTNVFIRDTKDLIMEFPIGNDEEFFENSNLGKVYTEGLDLELNYNYKQALFFSGSASLFNAKDYDVTYDTDGTPIVLDSYERLRNTPYFTMNYNVKYNKKGFIQKKSNFSCFANLLYVHQFYRHGGRFGGSGKIIIPTQTGTDLGCAYTFPNQKVTLSFDVKNIFNQQLFDNYALQKPGRAFYGKLTFSLL
ncbi:MAG: TonB-dependent receptor [Aestuariibaculum sp.]